MSQLLQFAQVEAIKRANNKVRTVLLDTLYCTALFPADEGYYYHWTGATDQRHEGTWLWGGETGSGGAVEDVAWMARE